MCQSDALTTKKSLADGAGRSQSCLCSDVSADHDQTDSFSTLFYYNFTHMHAVPTFTIGAQIVSRSRYMTVLLSGRWPRVNARPLANFPKPMTFGIYSPCRTCKS